MMNTVELRVLCFVWLCFWMGLPLQGTCGSSLCANAGVAQCRTWMSCMIFTSCWAALGSSFCYSRRLFICRKPLNCALQMKRGKQFRVSWPAIFGRLSRCIPCSRVDFCDSFCRKWQHLKWWIFEIKERSVKHLQAFECDTNLFERIYYVCMFPCRVLTALPHPWYGSCTLLRTGTSTCYYQYYHYSIDIYIYI